MRSTAGTWAKSRSGRRTKLILVQPHCVGIHVPVCRTSRWRPSAGRGPGTTRSGRGRRHGPGAPDRRRASASRPRPPSAPRVRDRPAPRRRSRRRGALRRGSPPRARRRFGAAGHVAEPDIVGVLARPLGRNGAVRGHGQFAQGSVLVGAHGADQERCSRFVHDGSVTPQAPRLPDVGAVSGRSPADRGLSPAVVSAEGGASGRGRSGAEPAAGAEWRGASGGGDGFG